MQYKQTILGPLWFLIQPVLTVIMNMVVFGGIAKMSTDGIPQPLFYLAGNVCWFYFSDCLNQTSSTFRNNAGMFGKVYLRMRENGGNTTRQIGVMYTDLDGYILSPPTTLFGDNYYQAGASILDDRRELLLPTFFDEKNDKNWYDAYIVEGTKITHLNTNINEVLMIPGKDGWGIICPKIITIGFEQYIYYMQWNYTHGKKMIGNENEKKTEIRCSKITWDTKGKPYKQF